MHVDDGLDPATVSDGETVNASDDAEQSVDHELYAGPAAAEDQPGSSAVSGTHVQHNIETVSRFLRHVQAREVRMTEQLRAAQATITHLEREVADSRLADEEWTRALAAELLRQISDRRDEIHQQVAEQYQQRVEELIADVEKKSQLIEQSSVLIEQLNKRLEQLEECVDTKTKAIETLNACAKHLEANEARLDEQLRAAQGTISALDRDLVAARREVEQWTRELPAAFMRKVDEQRDEVQKEISTQYEERILQLQSTIEQGQRAFEVLKEEADYARSTAAREVEDAQDRASDRIRQLEQVLEEKDRLANEGARSFDDELGKVTERIEELRMYVSNRTPLTTTDRQETLSEE